MDAKELSQGRALYERLHELMPADYPDAWVDLLETYKEKFAIAAIPTDAAQALEGWMLVPIEPTMEMVIDGFESCPSAIFSPQKDWEAFEAMSGCQQAAHKARLCYAAMLASAPVAPQAAGDAAALATQINRLRKDETRGDTVFRCGFNGAIDSVLKLLDGAAPVAPAAAAPITEAQRKAIDDAARVLGENWEHETADRLTEAFVASGASAAATSEPADWRGDFERKATVSGFDLSREESGGDYCHDRPAAAWLWYYSGRLDQACAAPTPTVAADAAAPNDTCACGYSLETSCNVLDPTCKRNAAQPDERAAWDGDSEESRAAFRAYDSVERARLRSKWQVWRDACAWQAARATAPQATVKGDERAAALIEAAKHVETLGLEFFHGQHEFAKTGRACVADAIRALSDRAAAPQAGATLTDEQRADIQKVIDCLEPDDWCGDESIMAVLNRVLATHPTERRVDRQGGSDAR